MVRPDSFERGQLRLTCISTVHSVYSEQAELVINEERPQIASVLGTRDRSSGKLRLREHVCTLTFYLIFPKFSGSEFCLYYKVNDYKRSLKSLI